MELRRRSSPRVIGWGDILALLNGLLCCLLLRFFAFGFLSDILILQSAAVEDDFDLSVELLSYLHFSSAHGGCRPIDEKLTVFPLDGISVGDGPLLFETEDVPVSDPRG